MKRSIGLWMLIPLAMAGAGTPVEGTGEFGAFAASTEWAPPEDKPHGKTGSAARLSPRSMESTGDPRCPPGEGVCPGDDGRQKMGGPGGGCPGWTCTGG